MYIRSVITRADTSNSDLTIHVLALLNDKSAQFAIKSAIFFTEESEYHLEHGWRHHE